MYKSSQEIKEKVFTPRVQAIILSNIKIGLKAFHEFIKSNEEFLYHSYFANFYPLARAYAISRQFAIEAEKATSPFTLSYKAIGHFKHKVCFLHMPGIIATIAKTYKPELLPNRSKYKLSLASANVFEDKQISILDYLGERKNDIIGENSLKYCIFTYGVINEILTHARIIIPNNDFKKCEENIDILNSIEIVDNIPDEEYESIPKLKKELQQFQQRFIIK